MKSVASKTGDDAGDGTTTATVLTQAILTEGMKNVAAGANPLDLKRGIDKAVNAVVEHIRSQAEQVGDNYDKIEQVATISANNDAEIGKLIADGMRAVTANGVITIETRKVATRCSNGGRYAVRPRLSLGLLRYRRREDAVRDGEPLHLDLRQEDF